MDFIKTQRVRELLWHAISKGTLDRVKELFEAHLVEEPYVYDEVHKCPVRTYLQQFTMMCISMDTARCIMHRGRISFRSWRTCFKEFT